MNLSPETWNFINGNLESDVRTLALGRVPEGVDLKAALTQIAGHRAALAKLPDWAAVSGLLYPVHLSMEQCTSQHLAVYKQGLVRDWMESGRTAVTPTAKIRFLDLTGGFGVDCFYLSAGFDECQYNEMNPELCGIAQHNFALLGRPDIRVSNLSAAQFLDTHANERFDLIYMDPARRDGCGNKLVSIRDCSPDVSQLQSRLFEVSPRVLVKLSPMLDIKKVLSELACVSRIMAISLAGECKELLVFMERGFKGETVIQAANLDKDGSVGPVLESTLQKELATPSVLDVNGEMATPGCYLYEPNAAIMKSGLFHTLSAEYGVRQVGESSHLFVSDRKIDGFPGRSFVIEKVVGFDKRTAKELFASMPCANIAVRNFPLTARELRQRFKVRDGGTAYVFATTAATGRILLSCIKP